MYWTLNGSGETFAYQSGKDIANNGTGDAEIGSSLGNANHDGISGYMSIFNAGEHNISKKFFHCCRRNTWRYIFK